MLGASVMLPDPIERGEARAAAAHADATRDAPEGKWLCPGCEKHRDLDDACPVSADPYSAAACHACIEEMYPGVFDAPEPKTCPHDGSELKTGEALGRPNKERGWCADSP